MYLLDTCVFSELIKKIPSKSVTDWILERDERLFFVSALTFAEIQKGIEKMGESAKKKKLETWYQDFLVPRFWDRLVAIDGAVANTWTRIMAHSEKNGRVLPTIDSLIGASAITHNLHIVTRNTKDFEGLQLTLVNPWI